MNPEIKVFLLGIGAQIIIVIIGLKLFLRYDKSQKKEELKNDGENRQKNELG